MGLINITAAMGGAFSERHSEIVDWLSESVGPEQFGEARSPSGKKSLNCGNNWRIFPVSYSLQKKYPDVTFPSSGWYLEFDDPGVDVMFKLRWM
jgi:hypothetical protein